jgi:hypothetical protein
VAAPALIALALSVSPAVAGESPACAAGVDHAALVIDTGARTTRYCVELDAPTISGLHLIELAADAYGLEYQLGFAGKAVCRLEGVGVDGGDCFDAFPDFWAYWRGDDSGGWTWSTIGAADTAVADGDVEGWSWGSGTDAASHQRPPRTPAASVCGDPRAGTGGGGAPPPGGSGGADGGHNGSSGNGGAGGGEQPQTNVGPAVGGADEPRAGADAGARGADGGGGRENGDAEAARSAARSHAGAETPGAATPSPASAAPPSPSAVSSGVEAMPLASNASRAAPPIAALAFAGAAIALLLLAGWLSLRRRAGSG